MTGRLMVPEDDDEPLDPKVEAIRRKMMRLLMVSGGIMMVGLMTVLIAIVYKITSAEVPQTAANAQLSIPAGSHVVSASADSGRVTLVLKTDDGRQFVRIYSLNGRLMTHYTIKTGTEPNS